MQKNFSVNHRGDIKKLKVKQSKPRNEDRSHEQKWLQQKMTRMISDILHPRNTWKDSHQLHFFFSISITCLSISMYGATSGRDWRKPVYMTWFRSMHTTRFRSHKAIWWILPGYARWSSNKPRQRLIELVLSSDYLLLYHPIPKNWTRPLYFKNGLGKNLRHFEIKSDPND